MKYAVTIFESWLPKQKNIKVWKDAVDGKDQALMVEESSSCRFFVLYDVMYITPLTAFLTSERFAASCSQRTQYGVYKLKLKCYLVRLVSYSSALFFSDIKL